MADRERWLLPDGVDEVLPPHARRLEELRRVAAALVSAGANTADACEYADARYGDAWRSECDASPFSAVLKTLV